MVGNSTEPFKCLVIIQKKSWLSDEANAVIIIWTIAFEFLGRG